MIFKKIFFILFFILFSINIFSENYGNFQIEIDEKGKFTNIIESNINLENIIDSQKFTSKKNEYWVVNYSSEIIFDEFYFEIFFPKNTKINYIKSTKNLLTEIENDKLKLSGFGQNKNFEILIQYSFSNNFVSDEKNSNSIFYYFLFFIIIIFIISIIIFFKKITQIKKDDDNEKFDYSYFPKRQIDIINILKKNKNKILQNELDGIMEIPNSSIYRNLKSLEKKGIIRKERVGKKRLIFLLK